MILTKKKVAILAVALVVLFFIPLLFLPESVVGERKDDNILLFMSKVLFLAVTAAIVVILVLILVVKRDFVSGQMTALRRYKHYLRLMIKRDFMTRYRKSVFGVLWSLLNPLLNMLVLTMVFQYLFRFQVENFPVYFLGGQMIFAFFSESTSLAMNSVINNEAIIKKIYVPKYVYPLSTVISSMVNLCFSFIAFLFVFIITGAQFQWTMLLIPIPIIYLFVFSLGIAMLMSSLTVFFRDLKHLYTVLLTLWMFLTPIMYPVDIVPDVYMPFYGLNPLFHFVTYFRNLALWGTVPDLWANMVCIGFSLASLCVGTYVFMVRQNRYILYL